MNTQFLIVPFPQTKNKYPHTCEEVNQAFGGSASNVVDICKRSKFPYYNEDAFDQYIPQLAVLMKAKVHTQYTNPFKSAYFHDSYDGAVEVANTLWNYFGYLHNKILEIDTSSVDYLREFRAIMEECITVTEDFAEVMKKLSHPFFNARLADFARAYHKYMIAIWQVSIVQVSGKSQTLVARQAMTAVERLRECEAIASGLPVISRSFFHPIMQSMLAYYNGFVFFQFGNFYANQKEYALTIQAYRTACKFFTQNIKVEFCPTVSNAVTSMKRACMSAKELSEEQNKQIYMVRVPPEDIPFPKSLPLQTIEPNKNLYIDPLFEETNKMLNEDPWNDPAQN